MYTHEWTQFRYNTQLDVRLLHAYYVQHAYPRHSHDYYVISLIESGRQSFTHNGTKYLTPPGGVILINPSEVHTGEAVDEQGFVLRSLYPTISHVEMAVSELTGHHNGLSFFKEVRVDHPWIMNGILSLHKALLVEASKLEYESRFLWVLAQLIKHYGDLSGGEQRLGKEKQAVRKAQQYIDEHFAQGITLDELGQYVALSPYYLLRAFSAEIGMPPYTYLESVRIREAQHLIESDKPLAQIATEVGFSSQSHLTNRFKQIIGTTPGQYAQSVRA